MDYIECCKVQIKGKVLDDLKIEDFPDPKLEMMWIDGKILTRNRFKEAYSESIKDGDELTINWHWFCTWNEANCLCPNVGDYVEICGTLQQTKPKAQGESLQYYIYVEDIFPLNEDGSRVDFESMSCECKNSDSYQELEEHLCSF